MTQEKIKIRKHLNQDSLIALMGKHFRSLKETRSDNLSVPLSDALLSSYALFSLKYPSVVAFENDFSNDQSNLLRLYGISKLPSDTQMREIVDNVSPTQITPLFKAIFDRLQKGKELERFRFLGDHYLVSCDGTEYFCSEKVRCPNCMERERRNGRTENYHQFYGAALVHPDHKEVIPFAPEAIKKQDGQAKNDCERNASKRFLTKFRKDHPKLKAVIIEDALASNAPHVKLLLKKKLDFIIGIKEKGNKSLFDLLKGPDRQEHSFIEGDYTHLFAFVNDVPLNESNPETKVNAFEYWEINNKTGKKQRFSWITSFEINAGNIYQLMRGGRARWKIENETFNTLKNQGYHFDHNFGHGDKNLSENFSLLMILAFLVDQACEIACPLFTAALKETKTRVKLWEKTRRLFDSFTLDSVNQIYQAIAFGFEKGEIQMDSS